MFYIKIILTAAIAFFTASLLPWYGIVIIAFVVNLILPGRGAGAFFSSFFAALLLWFITAFLIHNQSSGLLSDKIAQLIGLPNGIILALVTGIIGGLVTGFGGLTGSSLRNALSPPKKKKKTYS